MYYSFLNVKFGVVSQWAVYQSYSMPIGLGVSPWDAMYLWYMAMRSVILAKNGIQRENVQPLYFFLIFKSLYRLLLPDWYLLLILFTPHYFALLKQHVISMFSNWLFLKVFFLDDQSVFAASHSWLLCLLQAISSFSSCSFYEKSSFLLHVSHSSLYIYNMWLINFAHIATFEGLQYISA